MRHYTYAKHNGRPVVLINGWDFMEMTPEGPKPIGECTDHVPLEFACFGKVLYDACRADLGKQLIKYMDYEWQDNRADALIWLILMKRYADKFGGAKCEMIKPYTGESFCHGLCDCCFVETCHLYRIDQWDKKLFCEWLLDTFDYKYLEKFDGSPESNWYHLIIRDFGSMTPSDLREFKHVLSEPWKLDDVIRKFTHSNMDDEELFESLFNLRLKQRSSKVKEALRNLEALNG